MQRKINIAVFASGTGTNFETIVRYFSDHPTISIDCLVTNKSVCGAAEKAEESGIPVFVVDSSFNTGSIPVGDVLLHRKVEWIVLAGFLKKIPEALLNDYADRIINIHPALLPKFGGKGMYGKHVHKAVIHAGETESGITIHMVNGEYDKGRILFQATCPVEPADTVEQLEEKIHILEKEHFPRVILKTVNHEL